MTDWQRLQRLDSDTHLAVSFLMTSAADALSPMITLAPTLGPLSVEEQPSLAFHTLYAPARQEEQRAHFNAMASALHSRKAFHHLASLADGGASIVSDTIADEQVNRRYRLLCRLGALDPEYPQEQLFSRAEAAAVTERTAEQSCAILGITISSESQQLIRVFQEQEKSAAALASPEAFARAQSAFSADLMTLDRLLSSAPKDVEQLEASHHAILLTLRTLFASPLYTALCMSDLPIIDILHAIAISQYADTTLSAAFEALARQLPHRQQPLSERVQRVWDRLSSSGIGDGLWSTVLHYSLRLLVTIGLPYIALKIAQFLSLNWLIPSLGDERSILHNTPGAIADEIQTSPFGRRAVRTIVLPAPTLGSAAAPEFLAALQALENNQFSPDTTSYTTWAYTNLQTLSFCPERPSTIALMELRTLYPLSFHAITLPQHLPDSSDAAFSSNEIGYHLSMLYEDGTSLLENRNGDSGYSVPRSFLEEHRQAIQTLAQHAYQLVDRHRHAHRPSELKSAYLRLFHLGLSRLHETVTFTRTAQRTHRTAISALRTAACAACIDRGGMMNAASVYALTGNSDLAIGTYFGRALLSQRRSPSRLSAERLSALFAVVPQEEVRGFLMDISVTVTS